MERLTSTLKRGMLLIFIGIIILSLYMGTRLGATNLTSLVYGILLCYFMVKAAPRLLNCLDGIKEWKIFWGLSILCLVVKLSWIYAFRIQPAVDYATFYNYAVELAGNWLAESRYVALFPHIFGYSSFLSIFIRIFGSSYYLAPIINVILTLISGMMLYRIAKVLLDIKAAVFVYLLWIFCPSQTIYNSLVLSEPLYTTLIIAFVLMLTEIKHCNYEEKSNVWKMIRLGLLAGVTLRVINACRPIAAIFLIALFIWFFVLRAKELADAKFRRQWLSFLLSLVSVYVITGPLWDKYMTMRLGEEPAAIPGYSVMVGFNPQSLGRWNLEDSELLSYYSDQPDSTATWAQEKMLEAAKERISSGNIDFLYLFREKIKGFLGADDACVNYHATILSNTQDLSIICNSFYYAAMMLSVLGCVRLWKGSKHTVAVILPLYVIGLTLAQMLVEVAPRYHYSILPIILLIGSYVLKRADNQYLAEQKKG